MPPPPSAPADCRRGGASAPASSRPAGPPLQRAPAAPEAEAAATATAEAATATARAVAPEPPPAPGPVLERRPSLLEAEARGKARRQSLDRSNCYLTAATPAEAEPEPEAEVEVEAGVEAEAPPFAEPRAFSDTTHVAQLAHAPAHDLHAV